jgi:hypothetical protein
MVDRRYSEKQLEHMRVFCAARRVGIDEARAIRVADALAGTVRLIPWPA